MLTVAGSATPAAGPDRIVEGRVASASLRCSDHSPGSGARRASPRQPAQTVPIPAEASAPNDVDGGLGEGARRTIAVDSALAALDAWLETMRGPGGYGGPVAHWWQQSMLYTGAGLDWRYEGIIAGYLELWERTGEERWLAKAHRAGDDLVAGQLESGHYAASAFEMNPATAGTPHEAACDVGLLLLALSLRDAGRDEWERYAACAEHNLREFYIRQLWDEELRAVSDSPSAPAFVPNKAATACEALFLLADMCGDALWAERYALPTLDRILGHQVRGGPLDGAIAQNSFGGRLVARYFPIYIARCVPALVRGYRRWGAERFADAALRAMRFIARLSEEDGSLPAVVYPNGRANRSPRWVAPLGDVLRAADAAQACGFAEDMGATLRWLLDGQDVSGGIQTAVGFAAQAGGRPGATPDLRDLLHVVGWCDKAFRALASRAGRALPAAGSAPFEAACTFRGEEMRLVETPTALEVRARPGVGYRWRKGEPWPELASSEFWLR